LKRKLDIYGSFVNVFSEHQTKRNNGICRFELAGHLSKKRDKELVNVTQENVNKKHNLHENFLSTSGVSKLFHTTNRFKTQHFVLGRLSNKKHGSSRSLKSVVTQASQKCYHIENKLLKNDS